MLSLRIRWMQRLDMPEILEIEQGSFEFPWSEEDFIRSLRQRNCMSWVVEYSDKVVGFMIYGLHKARFHILNFAVHPHYRRRGVGKQMVNKLIESLSYQYRTLILLEVRETNLDAQLFFRQIGFRAVSVLRDFYEDTVEDAYLMEYNIKNRITHASSILNEW
jgi:[ribosomal protein S18]-alanine N-acetyltransferase